MKLRIRVRRWIVAISTVVLGLALARCDSAEIPAGDDSPEAVNPEPPTSEDDAMTALERKQAALNETAGKSPVNSEWNNANSNLSTYSNPQGMVNREWKNNKLVPGETSVHYDDLFSGSSESARLLALAQAMISDGVNDVKNGWSESVTSGGTLWQGALFMSASSMSIDVNFTAAFGRSTSVYSPTQGKSYGVRGGREPAVLFLGQGCSATIAADVVNAPVSGGCTDTGGDKAFDEPALTFMSSSASCIAQGNLFRIRREVHWGELGLTSAPGTCDGLLSGSEVSIDKEDTNYQFFQRPGNTSSDMPSGLTIEGETPEIDTPGGGAHDFNVSGANVDVQASENIYVWSQCTGPTFTKVNSSPSTSVSYPKCSAGWGFGVVVSAAGKKFLRYKYITV